MTSLTDLQAIRTTVEHIALSMGDMMREAYAKPRHIEFKGEVNLVTETDRAVEAAVAEKLKAEFPGYGILSEEDVSIEGSNGLTWIVDPLDGTNNFAHGFPVFSLSIGLRDESGPLVGVTYDPLRDECFSAAKGHGATLNGSPIHVSPTTDLLASLVATGFPYSRHEGKDNNIVALAAFLQKAQGIRRAGSAALDLAYVACGRLDAYWEMQLFPWDVTAGFLIVVEAGGVVTSYAGPEDDIETILQGKHVVASNGHVHEAMLDVLHDVYEVSPGQKLILK